MPELRAEEWSLDQRVLERQAARSRLERRGKKGGDDKGASAGVGQLPGDHESAKLRTATIRGGTESSLDVQTLFF